MSCWRPWPTRTAAAARFCTLSKSKHLALIGALILCKTISITSTGKRCALINTGEFMQTLTVTLKPKRYWKENAAKKVVENIQDATKPE